MKLFLRSLTIAFCIFFVSNSVYATLIFVKDLGGKTFTLEVENENTIEEVKKMVQDKDSRFSINSLLIVFGEVMPNSNKLSDYPKVRSCTTIHIKNENE